MRGNVASPGFNSFTTTTAQGDFVSRIDDFNYELRRFLSFSELEELRVRLIENWVNGGRDLLER